MLLPVPCDNDRNELIKKTHGEKIVKKLMRSLT